MKKIWFLMLMMCAVSVFTACSDDDGENEVPNPVIGAKVPSTGKIGDEVIIQGTGFTASDLAIYLENSSQDRFKMNASFNNAGASFNVPLTLTVGTYSVILVQNTEEWPLGSITLESADNPVDAITVPDAVVAPGEKILLGGIGYEQGDKIALQAGDEEPIEITDVTISDLGLQFTIPSTCPENEYVVSLVREANSWVLGNIEVQKHRRVKSLYANMEGTGEISLNLSYDNAGRLKSISSAYGDWNLVYGDNTITTTSIMTGEPLEYTLENGKVIKGSAFDAYDETEAYNTWNYEGEYLSSVINSGKWYEGMNINVVYNEEGNLNEWMEMLCEYVYDENSLKAIPNTIDLGFALHLPALMMKEDAIIPLLCNVAGKTSAKIPSQIKNIIGYTEEGEPQFTTHSITLTREGEVLKMITQGSEVEVTYEVIE